MQPKGRGAFRLPGWAWFFLGVLIFSLGWQVAGNWTDVLIALNVVSFLLQCYSVDWEEEGLLTADVGPRNGAHRLILSSFLHASWVHLAQNMCSLWYVGRPLERAFGPGRFLFAYLVGTVAGAGTSVWGKRRRGRRGDVPSVGASGGVCAAVAALAYFRWRHGRPSGSLWYTLALNILCGLWLPGVDYLGHLGGSVGGAAVSFLWGPRYVLSLGGFAVRSQPILGWPLV